MKSIKVFGTILILLGLFTGICAIYASNHVLQPDLTFAYQNGMLMGTAFTQCLIGTILSNFDKFTK